MSIRWSGEPMDLPTATSHISRSKEFCSTKTPIFLLSRLLVMFLQVNSLIIKPPWPYIFNVIKAPMWWLQSTIVTMCLQSTMLHSLIEPTFLELLFWGCVEITIRIHVQKTHNVSAQHLLGLLGEKWMGKKNYHPNHPCVWKERAANGRWSR